MGEKIGIGIIGIGFGQHVHAPAFRLDDRCEVRAIAASTQERAQQAASKLGIEKAYGDAKALIADPAIQAVSIAVPPHLQPSLIIAAAQAGKHIFCEKPVGVDLSAAMRALQAVREAKVVTAINFIFPEIAAWQTAKQIL